MRAALLALLLAGCGRPAVQDVAAGAVTAVEHAAGDVGAAMRDAAGDTGQLAVVNAAPASVALREAVQAIAPEPPPPVPAVDPTPDPALTLIPRWEVTSRAHYERRLSGLVCPPRQSGPTGGIGYDFGHQTRAEIRRVWGWHPASARLATASGQLGAEKCGAWRRANADIRISWDEAMRVFASDSLPKYKRMAMRALPGLDRQSAGHIGGLTSTGYRRGWSMEGERMREKRVIRDQCVPQDSADCSAGQVIAMCRIWAHAPDAKGQCNRSYDEARVIRS